MRSSAFLIFGFLVLQAAATAQTASEEVRPSDEFVNGSLAGRVATNASTNRVSYTSLTASERLRLYVVGTYGPGAILRAGAAGGIAQWNNTPKEWKQGGEAFGDRVGNSFATHIIRSTIESGAAALLHEDNRYFRSTDTGFAKRAKHAALAAFMTRNDAGREHVGYSRIGAAAGSSFISRAWQPPSATSAGDGAVNFGTTMAIDVGWNFLREFGPKSLKRFGIR